MVLLLWQHVYTRKLREEDTKYKLIFIGGHSLVESWPLLQHESDMKVIFHPLPSNKKSKHFYLAPFLLPSHVYLPPTCTNMALIERRKVVQNSHSVVEHHIECRDRKHLQTHLDN